VVATLGKQVVVLSQKMLKLPQFISEYLLIYKWLL
jgi:hypothetical protein